jgi:uncharacterized protein (TIGR02145 family)
MILAQHGINSLKKANEEYVSIGGYDYKVVTIGNRKWLAENLRLEIGSFIYYNRNKTLYEHMGCYYSVGTISQINTYLQGTGWRVPTDNDLQDLLGSLDSPKSPKLKSTTEWTYNNGNNESGFNGFPYSRYDYTNNNFTGYGLYERFWTSTQIIYEGGSANIVLSLRYDDDENELYSRSFHSFWLHIRLCKDV